MSNYNLGDPQIVENILAELKKSGLFDQFRKECIADVDTKPAYQNLRFKVESSVASFLSKQKWTPETNRLQLRERLRKNLVDSSYLESGIERIVEQVLNPKMESIKTQVEDLLCKQLNIDRPKKKPEIDDQKEESLLPTDLEAVSSPESDTKNVEVDLDCSKEDEDFESPAFEPLEGYEVETEIKKEESESRMSGLSGLSSEGKQLKIDEASQLSVVSSGSRLSIVVASEKDESSSPKPEVFSEEAQMPKFNENSNSQTAIKQETNCEEHAFDFKKEEIEFQGTDRKMTLDEKLKEEILESENKRANAVIDEQETMSQSSDIKLEIVESQEVTKPESSVSEKREDDKGHRSSSKHKKERDRHRRSRSRDRKDVKKEDKRDDSKKSSSSRDKHKRHDHRDRRRSRSRSRDRKHRSRSRSRDRKQHRSRSRSRDRKKDTHKRSSHHKDRRSDRKEPPRKEKPEFDPAAVELYTNPPGFEEPDTPPELKPEIAPQAPLKEEPEMPVLEEKQIKEEPIETIKEEQIKEELKELGTESLSEDEPNFLNEDEPFYGFTEEEINSSSAVSSKKQPQIKKEEPSEVLNKSILEEDLFLGFDNQAEQKNLHEIKRTRKPNSRYSSEDFANLDNFVEEPQRKRRTNSDPPAKKAKRDRSGSSKSSGSDSLPDEKKNKRK